MEGEALSFFTKIAEFVLKEAVLDVLQEAEIEGETEAQKTLAPREISWETGIDNGIVYGLLGMLEIEGRVIRLARGQWMVPEEE